MKHYRFTAEECIGWLRIARPGSVIGPQQHFLKDMQSKMWKDGDLLRATLKGVLSSSNSSSSTSNDNSIVNGGSMNKLNQAGTPMSLHQNMKNLSVNSSSSSPYNNNNNNSNSHSHHNSTPTSSNSSPMMMMMASNNHQDSNIRIPTPSSSANRLSAPSSSSSNNVNSTDRQREERGETTQGDLLRQRRAQAMHHSPSSLTGSGSGSGNKVSPTSPTTSPPSTRTFTSFLSSWTK